MGAQPTMTGFSARRAAQLTGCSYRQLDYWCRTGLLDPEHVGSYRGKGSGSRREFTLDDLHELRLIRFLYELGAYQETPAALALVRDRAGWAPEPWSGLLVVHRGGRCELNGKVHAAAWVIDLAACVVSLSEVYAAPAA